MKQDEEGVYYMPTDAELPDIEPYEIKEDCCGKKTFHVFTTYKAVLEEEKKGTRYKTEIFDIPYKQSFKTICFSLIGGGLCYWGKGDGSNYYTMNHY